MTKTIMQVVPSLVSGGVETGTLDLARNLVEKGYRSIVVSSGGPLVGQLEKQGSQHISLPVHSKNPLLMLLNSRKLAKIVETESVNLIHARSRAPAWSCLWASKLVNIPFITTFHGVYGHQNGLKRWYNSAMLRSDKTIAVSEYVKNHIASVYPRFSHKVKLILRGIDLERFDRETTQNNEQQLRADWHLPENTNIIVLPGRLTRIKGHTVLIDALSKLQNQEFVCLFVGDEPGKDGYRKELESFIASKGMQDKFRFTGNIMDMPSVYKLADLVISASIKPESFGRIACEAQLMESIVVASNHGGSQETISPALRPYMCQPKDVVSMTHAIEKALQLNHEDRLALGAQAADYIRTHFTLDRMCQETIALYELELSKQ